MSNPNVVRTMTRWVAVLAWVAVFGGAACESPDQSRDEGQPESSERAQSAESGTSGRASGGAAVTEAAGFAWRSPIEIARGNARAGPWRMNDSRFHYIDDPSVELWDDGTDVVWVDNQNQQVRFWRYEQTDGDGLDAAAQSPTTVSRSPEIFSWLPRIETAGPDDQLVYVLWQEIVFSGGSHGGEAFFARSTDGGESFEEPMNLSETQMGIGKGRLTEEIWHNGSLDLAVGPDGTVYGAWTAYQGPLEFRRSTDRGESFSETITIAGSDEAPARAPSIAVAPDGTVWLAWTVGESEAADLRLAVSTDGGASFSEPAVILESDGHSDAPKLAATEEALHLVYAEADDGMFERYDVRYARGSVSAEPDSVPAFGQSRRLSADPTSTTDIDSAHFPSMALSADDDPIVLWNRYADHDDPPRGLRIAVSRDEGESFTDPVDIPGTNRDGLGINGSLQGMLMEKLDAADNRLGVVNSRFDAGQRSLIRLIPARDTPQ